MLKNFFSKKKPSSEYKLILDSEAHIESMGVLTQSFGIRIFDGSIAPFSKCGDAYPSKGSYTFSTDEDNQDQITLEFHRSSESMATSDSYLGQVRIRGYELEKAREPLVRVHYELSNGKIVIWATDEKSEKSLSVSVVKNNKGESVH